MSRNCTSLAAYFPRISPAKSKGITEMKHSVLAEVALFIQHPYA